MNESRSEQIMECLRQLHMSTPDMEAAAVVHRSGLVMSSTLPLGAVEDRVAAMSAAMIALDERIAQELSRGRLLQTYLRGEHGYICMVAVGDEAVLTTLARDGAMVGLVLHSMQRVAQELAQLI
ncbi:MAG: roadblock/LC7 domain-containing protein [Chloroflexi bacterium]|nr:roadblock/LC7 domain-containing protein [Chloroflexota bacterium]MBU1746531.1 roadblock/LC7 domain-containing protein [Chloroflexota bacterium]